MVADWWHYIQGTAKHNSSKLIGVLFPLNFAWKSQTGMQWNNFQGELFINKWHEYD